MAKPLKWNCRILTVGRKKTEKRNMRRQFKALNMLSLPMEITSIAQFKNILYFISHKKKHLKKEKRIKYQIKLRKQKNTRKRKRIRTKENGPEWIFIHFHEWPHFFITFSFILFPFTFFSFFLFTFFFFFLSFRHNRRVFVRLRTRRHWWISRTANYILMENIVWSHKMYPYKSNLDGTINYLWNHFKSLFSLSFPQKILYSA